MATTSTGSLGTEPDSASARNRKAPANPRTALPTVEKMPAEDSSGWNPLEEAERPPRWIRETDNRESWLAAGEIFDSERSASLREALLPLTRADSSPATRASSSL